MSWDTSSSFAVEGFKVQESAKPLNPKPYTPNPKPWTQNGACFGAKALEALPALSAAAAAAAFDAAGKPAVPRVRRRALILLLLLLIHCYVSITHYILFIIYYMLDYICFPEASCGIRGWYGGGR